MLRSAIVFTSLLVASPAVAAEGPVDRGATVLIGTGTAFDEDPETLRLSVRGELPIVGSDTATLGAVLPLSFRTEGESAFGVSVQRTLLELPPSLRVRAIPTMPVRPYADGGLGLAWMITETDGWFQDQTTTRAGWMSRVALGVELGPTDGNFAVVVEPASWRTYHIGDADETEFGAMIGVGARY